MVSGDLKCSLPIYADIHSDLSVKITSGGKDGAISNATYTTGLVGDYALDFELTDNNEIVTIPDDSSLNISGDLTISAWIKLESAASVQRIFYKNYASDASSGVTLVVNNSALLGISYRETGDYTRNFGSTTLQTNTNYHVVGVISSGTVKLYVNGLLETNSASSNNLTGTGTDLNIGARAVGQQQFDGVIDEVRFYNRALSQAEVTKLYQKDHIQDGLVGYWDFEEGSGIVAHDRTNMAIETLNAPTDKLFCIPTGNGQGVSLFKSERET